MHPSKEEKDEKISIETISYYPVESRLEVAANDIIVNLQPNGFCSHRYALILDEFNREVLPENHFKNSALLIKAWCLLEAPRLLGIENFPGMIKTPK